MVAMEFAATYPTLARNVVVLAAPAEHPASAIAWSHIQRRAIAAAGEEGLEIARMIAMMTYRTAGELADRFGREGHEGGGFAVERYLSRQGEKLRARFDQFPAITADDKFVRNLTRPEERCVVDDCYALIRMPEAKPLRLPEDWAVRFAHLRGKR